jgi:hypothetical protein
MHGIGEKTARAFKTLAGLDKDEPASAGVFALYGFLFCIAFVVILLWLTGAEV